MADNVQLEKTIQVNGETYDINAVQADRVANKLILKGMNLDGTVSAENSGKWTVFDGSSEQSINIVPAAGGQFEGKIRVPDLETAVNGKDVLNYNDIVGKVVNRLLNTSAMATWDNNELTFTDTETPAIHGICVVLGYESDVASFAESNNEKKWLHNYLYICEDSGDIYLGKAESAEIKRLSDITNDEVLTPKSIEVAENQWITAGKYGLDMANSDVINLNGLFFADYANLNNEGLNFVQKHPDEHAVDNDTIKDLTTAADIIYDRVYARQGKFYFVPNCTIQDTEQRTPFEVYHSGNIVPITNGGTGKNNLADVTVGTASKLETSRTIITNLASTATANFNGTSNISPGVTGTLPVANGGTGQTSLGAVTVGNTDTIKVWYTDNYPNWSILNQKASITVSTQDPQGGYNGDIWIKI